MTPYFPIIELVDRYSIAQLKFEKTQANAPEVEFYCQQLSTYDLTIVATELDELNKVHKEIWQLESELKSGCEHQLELAEIGLRAIKIRDWNHKRIALKNNIADKLGQGNIHDIKKDHLSE
jgi:hypothetical protein